jgi:nicotinamidase-related amidase
MHVNIVDRVSHVRNPDRAFFIWTRSTERAMTSVGTAGGSGPWTDRLGFGSTPADDVSDTTALVVVDMQYFDAARDAGEGQTAIDLGVASYFDDYFGQIDDITPRIADLLADFRAKKMEVVHLRVAEVTQDSRDVGLKQLVRGLVVPIDSKEAEFLPGLEPVGDEIVINKSSSGVFPATNFDRLLRNVGIRTLVFTGTSTSGCIQSAVYDALDLGYEVLVVDDACADATTPSQTAALAAYDGTGVRRVTTAGLRERLKGLPDGRPERRSGLERVKPYLPTRPFLPNDRPAGEVSPYSLIFGPAIRLDVGRDNAAVVLVDAQRMFCDADAEAAALVRAMPGCAGVHARIPAALDAMARLLAGVRRLGYPVVHVRTGGHMADGRDLSAKLRRLGLRAVIGEAATDIMPAVAPVAGEAVLTKPGSGIFTGSGLDELLRNLGVRHLVMAGISFDGTLEASIRSSGDRGYGVLLVPDACAGSEDTERTLWAFDKGTVNVAPVDRALARLAGEGD